MDVLDPDPTPAPGRWPDAQRCRTRAVAGWRVVKLGGTTVGAVGATAGAVRYVAKLAPRKRTAVVVSALAGVTDTIDGLVDDALAGACFSGALDALAQRHAEHLSALVDRAPAYATTDLGADIASLRGLLCAFRRSGIATSDLRALAISIGERLAAKIVFSALRYAVGPVELVDPSRLLAAEGPAEDAMPDLVSTRRRTGGHLVGSTARIWVVPGFFAQDRYGRLRLLGRGGSDTSATLLAAALAADRVEIWTDVDGVYNADPRRDPAARRFDRLGFDDAEKLARGGARVLHDRSIAPARTAAVPILVRNSFQPRRRGTWIDGTLGYPAPIAPRKRAS